MKKKTVNLALQGGGAHGAFTWGVLDRLAEEEKLSIEGISGTSAGAINAALFIDGLTEGGADGAKTQMEIFWRRVSDAAAWSPFRKAPFSELMTGWDLDYSPAYHWFDMMSRVISPYMFNPLNVNPMRDILDDLLDFDRLRNSTHTRLFVTATHIASGQAQVFTCEEITADVLLASSCLPFLFQAVEIEGDYYWDGGYMGNPAIWPLIYYCKSKDVVLVQINPIHSDNVPRTSNDIINRLNEITFNSSLIAEMRAIDFVRRLIEEKRLSKSRYKDMRMHLIYDAKKMHRLNASSKMNTDWDFFLHLRDIGRGAADKWIRKEWQHIGVKPTIDIREKFLFKPSRDLNKNSKKRAGKNK